MGVTIRKAWAALDEFEKGILVTPTSPMVAAVAPDARMTSSIAPATT
jgi:hypothetical protein